MIHPQVSEAVRKHLQPYKNVDNVVEIKPYDTITGFLSDISKGRYYLAVLME